MALGGSDARGGYMGFYARVVQGGVVRLDDVVELLDE
jgi:MOSC domain-containing protein YiiM